MNRATFIPVAGAFLGILILSGCVNVDTPDVRVDVSRSSSPPDGGAWSTHGEALHDVDKQRYVIIEEVNKRDWEEAQDETGDWIEDIQELRSYAATSRDPGTFEAYCDEFYAIALNIRQAVDLRDAVSVRENVRAAEVVLNRFDRDFPRTR